MSNYISDAVIRRLPRYRRYLRNLENAGISRVSSKELGEMMDVTASQIRQDLNHFGGFGQQGYGYGVADLGKSLEEIMGLDKTYNIAFIGCGRLGQAMIGYLAGHEPHYKIVALCDNRPEYVGKEFAGIKVVDKATFRERLKEGGIDIIAITAPARIAEEVAADLPGTGVRGVWNFGHTDITLKGVHVMNVHLSDSLHALTYYINHID